MATQQSDTRCSPRVSITPCVGPTPRFPAQSARSLATHPVHSVARHPLPWHAVHCAGLAEHPLTSDLAQADDCGVSFGLRAEAGQGKEGTTHAAEVAVGGVSGAGGHVGHCGVEGGVGRW
jgi:hypothetical protein